MLIRTGGGHAARLSIPRDTIVEIPGHGLQKINAAHAFGGPALSVSVIKSFLGMPINHVVEVNFEDFPQLIDAMGGVTYSGGCIISRLDGGFARGGYTLRLSAGTHHLNGKQALALARTRENLCAPSETDLQREEHQQALFTDMKSRLLSPSSFFRLPLIAWNAPPAIISDMSGADAARPVRRACDLGHAADADPQTVGQHDAARRRGRLHRLRSRAARGGRAVHERLSVSPRSASAAAGLAFAEPLPACSPDLPLAARRRSRPDAPSLPGREESADEESARTIRRSRRVDSFPCGPTSRPPRARAGACACRSRCCRSRCP